MTWTLAADAPIDGSVYTLCWSSSVGEFVGGGFSNDFTEAVMRSADGITWTYQETLFDAGGYCQSSVYVETFNLTILGGNDAGSGAGRLISSTDHSTWVDMGNPFPDGPLGPVGAILTLACKQSTGLVMAGTFFGAQNIATCPDGATFTAISSPFDAAVGAPQVQGIDYDPDADRWMASGLDDDGNLLVAYSDDDGDTWTVVASSPMIGVANVFSIRGRWYLLDIVPGDTPSAAYSDDGGATWSDMTSDIPQLVNGVQAMIDTGSAIAIGGEDADSESALLVSLDGGATWALDETPNPFPDSFYCFAFSADLDLAVAGGA